MSVVTTLDFDACLVIFGHSWMRPDECVFISKWDGSAMNITLNQLIYACKQVQADRKANPDLIIPRIKRAGRHRA